MLFLVELQERGARPWCLSFMQGVTSLLSRRGIWLINIVLYICFKWLLLERNVLSVATAFKADVKENM